MEGIYTSKQCVYTLHFSLVHSLTVLGVLYVLYMLSVFFDLRCESDIYIYAKQKHLGCKKSARPIRSNMQAGRCDQKL